MGLEVGGCGPSAILMSGSIVHVQELWLVCYVRSSLLQSEMDGGGEPGG